MPLFPGIRRAFRLGVWRRELDEELSFHFEETVRELVATGKTEREARDESRRRFGNERRWRRDLERIDSRAARGRSWGARREALWGGARLALRRIRRSPGFAVAVVLTFALGIGANATMFGIVDRLLLSPPKHIAEPGEVRRVMIDRFVAFTGEQSVNEVFEYTQYVDVTEAKSFADVAAYATREVTVGRGEGARRLEAQLVTGSFFSLLGVRPEVGRLLSQADDRRDAATVAVISHRLWRADYGSAADVVGRTIDFGHGPYTVVGVAPEGFSGVTLEPVDLWLPVIPAGVHLDGPEWIDTRNRMVWLRMIARLAPGATPETAAAEASVLHLRGQREAIKRGSYDPAAKVVMAPLIEGRGPNASEESAVAKWLAGISLIVLLVACANVANLLLARALQQQREIGVRLALGGSRARVLAQMLIESMLLALLGGVAAVGLSLLAGGFVRRVLLPEVDFGESGMDLRTTLATLALVAIAGLSAGLIPAVQSSRPDLARVLKSGGRSASTRSSRTRVVLMVLQSALSVMLLFGAGLFVRSLHRAVTLDLGLDPRGVLLVEPVFDGELSADTRRELYRGAVERLERLPQVEAVSTDFSLPFSSVMSDRLRVPGLDSLPRLAGGGPYIHEVGHAYFDVLSLRVLRGRAFQKTDREGAPLVAVVSETMARTLWPAEDALGRCLLVGRGDPQCSTVVGVVEDARRFALEEDPAMQYYVPVEQNTGTRSPFGILVRVRGEERAAVAALRNELLAVDPAIRFAQVRPLTELVDPLARSWRLGAMVLSVFGLLALLVAGIGMYSVLAFDVAQRTFELGIRAAVGATRGRLVGLVLGRLVRLTALGLVLGLALALFAGRRLEQLLFQVSPGDPTTLGLVAGALALVALFAGALPAWRATRVDPSVALRAD